MTQLEKLQQLENHLLSRLKGQSHIIARVNEVVLRGEFGLVEGGRTRGNFLFVGPTGVGKTELVLALAEFLYGTSVDTVARFDMSEFSERSALPILLGAGSSERGRLGDVCATGRRKIFLFDELEKAHSSVWDLFLQICEPGHITVASGEKFSFEDCYIVFTSNVGSRDLMKLQFSPLPTIETIVERQLKEVFRPEFLNRIDERIVFRPLDEKAIREIAIMNLEQQVKFLAERNIRIQYGPEVPEFLMRVGFNREMGARPMRQAVRKHVQGPIAQAIKAGYSGSGILRHERGRTSLTHHAIEVMNSSAA